MGSPTAQSVQEAIYWQYAGLIAARVYGPDWKEKDRGFQMGTFKKLKSGEMTWSDITRDQDRFEEELVRKNGRFCVYCERTEKDVPMHNEHIIPRIAGGPGQGSDYHVWNRVPACQDCNLSKGAKGLYAWKGYEGRHEIPRIAEGRYLKLLQKLHGIQGSIDWAKTDLQTEFCPRCSQQGKVPKCPRGGPVKVIEMICVEALILQGDGPPGREVDRELSRRSKAP